MNMFQHKSIRSVLNRIFPGPLDASDPILPAEIQIQNWYIINRKMKWNIDRREFIQIAPIPRLSAEDAKEGFIGCVLCFGFSSEKSGVDDSVISGKLAWEYAQKRRRGKTWQCQYADFNRPEDIRLRPGAPLRPRGFYWIKLNPGGEFRYMSVAQFRKSLKPGTTGCGPEGFQLLAITHPHMADLMNHRKLNFVALADYDIAPHGFNDFYDAPQLFCSNGILGLGVGNIDGPYPLFGIPKISFH